MFIVPVVTDNRRVINKEEYTGVVKTHRNKNKKPLNFISIKVVVSLRVSVFLVPTFLRVTRFHQSEPLYLIFPPVH